MYERSLVKPVFDPWVQDLFADVGLALGDRVLDVACGRTLSDEERQNAVAAIARDSAELVRLHTDGAGFTYEIGTNVVLARA
jgi:hypothetical protein